LSRLTREEKLAMLELAAEKERRARGRKIAGYFPATGPTRRELYPKHLDFFRAGAKYRERCFLAGNRVGKTDAGAFELVCHLTGQYPAWWEGKRFNRAVKAWVAGDTGKTVREIIQAKLLGPPGSHGSGFVPADALVKTTPKQGVPEAVDTFYVKHVSGGVSQAAFKSYDQKRIAFQGDEQDVIWLDEESPLDVYTESLLRTMTTGGIVMLTFTPLMGLTETVMAFLPNGEIGERQDGSKSVTMAGWDDVPHLSAEVKAELLASIPPFQRDARSKGIPQLGAGAIYPVPESDFVIDDMAIPDHWPKAFGMDVGWNRTAAIFGAINRETDTLYLYSEHYRGQAEPAIHAEGIKSRGLWIPGVIDPASRGRAQSDGAQLVQIYKNLGMDLEFADNSVEAGIYEVWTRLSTGRLKVFRSLGNFLQEFRLYRRDERGRIVKNNDHLQDSLRYLVMSGIARAKTKPAPKPAHRPAYHSGSAGWMG
jgi:phage terminase large subunit-like protein